MASFERRDEGGDEWKRRAEYAERELSNAFGLPASVGPVEGEAKRMFDAAIAERDRLRELLDDRSCEAGLYARRMIEAQSAHAAVVAERDRLIRKKNKWRKSCLDAEQERDRLRRELEALRDAMVNEWRRGDVDASSAALRLRFDAILSGEGER